MELLEVELRRLRMPLVTPFRTSKGTQQERDVLLVRVRTAEAEGWGECVAGPVPDYTSEHVAGAEQVLRDHLVPAVLAAREVEADGVGEILAWVQGHRMAKASLEAAVLDAELRVAGESLSARLGGTREAVDAGVAVGITGSVAELLDSVGGYLDEGYRRVKLKVEPGWDVEPVRAVRERFGDAVQLQVDGNAAYRLDDSPTLAALDPFDLLLVEQPLPADDLVGHAELSRRMATPICLDESIRSVGDATTAIALGACSIVNIKPGRVGGLLEARRLHDLCHGRGVPVWCGGMLETGIGRAANVALASLPGFTLPGDLSASGRYFRQDLTPPFVVEDGRLRVPVGPGIGVEPLMDVVDELTTSVERFGRG
ncbi:MAG: o-succinylbenzoate synthase [Acidimicrobiales bacterium]